MTYEFLLQKIFGVGIAQEADSEYISEKKKKKAVTNMTDSLHLHQYIYSVIHMQRFVHWAWLHIDYAFIWFSFL